MRTLSNTKPTQILILTVTYKPSQVQNAEEDSEHSGIDGTTARLRKNGTRFERQGNNLNNQSTMINDYLSEISTASNSLCDGTEGCGSAVHFLHNVFQEESEYDSSFLLS